MKGTALIIGITGSFGRAVAAALADSGWRIRALHRAPEGAASAFGPEPAVEWQTGDAMQMADVQRAAAGVDIIVHAANPPAYRNWRGLALPMLANTIAAARTSCARILFPGNVYNFGPDAGHEPAEDAPQNPHTRKGRVRVEMEAMLAEGAARGARAIILRAGDFFGPTSGSGWFDRAMVRPGRPVRRIVYPGDPEVGHGWAYLPDFAATFARLAEREADLDTFERFHFRGHYLPRGVSMAETIRGVVGDPGIAMGRLPWWALRLGAPFNETWREILEMRYLWQVPLALDNRRLVGLLGDEPHTPLVTAVERTLSGLGCLGPRGVEDTAGVLS